MNRHSAYFKFRQRPKTSGCRSRNAADGNRATKKKKFFFVAGNFASLAARKCVSKTTKNRANRVQWNFAANVDGKRHNVNVRLSHKIRCDATSATAKKIDETRWGNFLSTPKKTMQIPM